MNIKKHFQYDPSVEVYAAQIGVSRWNWKTIDSNNYAEALNIMTQNRFDVLPIVNSKGKVTNYFSTVKWNNYERLNELPIKDSQRIYYKLSLKDLVRKFKLENQHYYFLTDYEENLGLVSYVNLNCQLVYNYLFNIISDMERSISSMLKEHISQTEIIESFRNSTDNHQRELVQTFEDSMQENLDSDIFQHMYLQTIGITINKFHQKLPPQFKKLNKYSSNFGSNGIYNLIRIKAMHPVRPILSDMNSINQIDELLSDYSAIKDILEEINSATSVNLSQ